MKTKYKRLKYCLSFLVGFSLISGVSNIQAQLPSRDENYSITQQPQVEGAQSTTDLAALSMGNKRALLNYYDGLGRDMQKVEVASSPYYFDIIFPVEYDPYGREVNSYRPYTKVSNWGNFVPNAVNEQANFYSNQPKVMHTLYPYDQYQFDDSPLNKVVETGFSGDAWSIQGQGNTIETSSRTNFSSEDMFFTIQHGLPHYGGAAYGSGSLSAELLTNENGITSELFRDIEGRLMLSKTPFSPTEIGKTYYIYDDHGRIRFILPPKAVKDIEINGNGVINSTFIEKLCFFYIYDENGRLIEKGIPDKGPVFFVYNLNDQIAMLQDARNRDTDSWSFSKFDDQGRNLIKGIFNASPGQDRAALQAIYDASTIRTEENTGTNFANLHGYTNNSFPDVLASNVEVNTVNYFDSYDFDRDLTPDRSYWSLLAFAGNKPSSSSTGLMTRTKTKVLGNNTNPNDWIDLTYFYNQKGKIIQHQEWYAQGGGKLTSYDFNFVGLVENEFHLTAVPWLTGFDRFIVYTKRQTYDRGNRPVHTYFRMNGGEEVRLSSLEYNEIGELIQKQLHGKRATGNPGWASTKYLQDIDYKYNERGWVTHINDFSHNCNGYSTLRVRRDIGRGIVNHFGHSFYQLIAERVEDDLEINLTQIFPILESDEPLSAPLINPVENLLDVIATQPEVVENLNVMFSDLGPEAGTMIQTFVQDMAADPELPSVHTFFLDNLEIAGDSVIAEKLAETLGLWLMDNLSPETASMLDQELQTYFSIAESSPDEQITYVFPEEIIDMLLIDIQIAAQLLTEDFEQMNSLLSTLNKEASNMMTFGFAGMNEVINIEPAAFETEVNDRLQNSEVQVQNQDDIVQLLQMISSELNGGSLGTIVIGGISNEVPITGGCKLKLTDNEDLFAMRVEYDTDESSIGSVAQYNGNITALRWVHNEPSRLKHQAYEVQYDQANRLLEANYGQKTSTWGNNFQDRYTVDGLSYDVNGNILTLKRNGAIDFDGANYTFGQVDDLQYLYNGNQLLGVDDQVADLNFNTGRGFDFNDRGMEIFNNPQNLEYEYDESGNLITDHARNMTINYNYLNYPESIEVLDNNGNLAGRIEFLYDLGGRKIQKTTFDATGQVTNRKFYLNGIEYASNGPGQAEEIESIRHDEGRLVKDNGQYVYEYVIRDHLNNTRVTFSDRSGNRRIENIAGSTEVMQRQDFYPFGSKTQGAVESTVVSSEDKYQFNGKEFNDDAFQVGVNDWVYLDQYDFGARLYDPVIGRWPTVDPLAEKLNMWSPYTYALNNPVNLVDPDGKEPTDPPKIKPDTRESTEYIVEVYKTKELTIIPPESVGPPFTITTEEQVHKGTMIVTTAELEPVAVSTSTGNPEVTNAKIIVEAFIPRGESKTVQDGQTVELFFDNLSTNSSGGAEYRYTPESTLTLSAILQETSKSVSSGTRIGTGNTVTDGESHSNAYGAKKEVKLPIIGGTELSYTRTNTTNHSESNTDYHYNDNSTSTQYTGATQGNYATLTLQNVVTASGVDFSNPCSFEATTIPMNSTNCKEGSQIYIVIRPKRPPSSIPSTIEPIEDPEEGEGEN